MAVAVSSCDKSPTSSAAKPTGNTEPLVKIATEPTNSAWWLRAQFRPADEKVRDIPVMSLDSSWQLASEFRKDFLTKEVLGEDGSAQMETAGLSFNLSGDFNKDGVEDLALVGVYQDRAGARGNFLVVMTKTDTGGWRKVFLKAWPGQAGFLSLRQIGNKLQLWNCMACDMPEELAWDEKAKSYTIIPPKPYQ